MIILILLLISFAATPVFILLLRKYSLRVVIAFITALILVSILAPFYTVYTFGGAFGLGILLYCLAPLAGLVSLLIMLGLYPRFSPVFKEEPVQRRVYLVGGLLVAALQCSPFVGSYLINTSCNIMNQELSKEMIATLEAYKQAQGHYPENLEELIPTYLPSLPSPACSSLSGNEPKPNFELEQCLPEDHLITIPSVDGSSIWRYNLATGNWSSISFLDGACSFLK
jgi:hypothetical protein